MSDKIECPRGLDLGPFSYEEYLEVRDYLLMIKIPIGFKYIFSDIYYVLLKGPNSLSEKTFIRLMNVRADTYIDTHTKNNKRASSLAYMRFSNLSPEQREQMFKGIYNFAVKIYDQKE